MPAFKIKVKWGKEVFSDVEVGFLIERLFIMFASKVNTDEEPMVFKAQLMALTGVQPERQKVMLKGAILGDQTWDKVGEIALDRLDNHLSSGEASGRCDDPYDGHQGRGHANTARGKDKVTTSFGFWSNTRICFKSFTSLYISSPMIISIVCPPGLLKTWTKMRSARRWRCRRGCRTSATLAT